MMKNNSYKLRYAVVIGVVVLVGCSKTKVPAPANLQRPTDTSQYLSVLLRQTPYHLFQLALNRSGLDSVSRSTTKHTFLVPADEAFISAGLTEQVINGLPADSLKRLLAYHIAYGAYTDEVFMTSIVNFFAKTLGTDGTLATQLHLPYLPYLLYLYKKGDTLKVRGKVVSIGHKGINGSNGVIQPIDAVLEIQRKTIWNQLNTNPNFSFFVSAIRFIDRFFDNSSIYLYPFLSTSDTSFMITTAPKTVFVPTNTAFNYAGCNTLAEVENFVLTRKDYVGNVLMHLFLASEVINNNVLYKDDFKNSSYINAIPYNETPFSAQIFYDIYNFGSSIYSVPTYPYNGSGGRPKPLVNYGILNFKVVNDSLLVGWPSYANLPPAKTTLPDIDAYDGVIQGVNRFFDPFAIK